MRNGKRLCGVQPAAELPVSVDAVDNATQKREPFAKLRASGAPALQKGVW